MRKWIAVLLCFGLAVAFGCDTVVSNGTSGEKMPSASALETEEPALGSFVVHFIDVGQADAALLLCDGETMLIDGGNMEDADLLYTYLSEQGVDRLDYVVCTHAHEDHAGGLPGALSYATANTVLCSVREADSYPFEQFLDAVERQGLSVHVPHHGDSFAFGGATCTVLAPISSTDNVNNTSLVLHFQYGETSFLFMGDAEYEVEQEILNRGYSVRATVLKVGHHGSSSSSSYRFLNEVLPEYAVLSCGRNNDYGHPHDEVMSRLRDARTTIYRTDEQGHIVCSSDGRTVRFETERSIAPQTPIPLDYLESFVLNSNSRRFHSPDCDGIPDISERNRENYYGTRQALLDEGYEPCGRCDP